MLARSQSLSCSCCCCCCCCCCYYDRAQSDGKVFSPPEAGKALVAEDAAKLSYSTPRLEELSLSSKINANVGDAIRMLLSESPHDASATIGTALQVSSGLRVTPWNDVKDNDSNDKSHSITRYDGGMRRAADSRSCQWEANGDPDVVIIDERSEDRC